MAELQTRAARADMCTTQFPSKASCRVHVSFYKINRAKTRSNKIQNEQSICTCCKQTNNRADPPPSPYGQEWPAIHVLDYRAYGRPLHAAHDLEPIAWLRSKHAYIIHVLYHVKNTLNRVCEKHVFEAYCFKGYTLKPWTFRFGCFGVKLLSGIWGIGSVLCRFQ